MKLHGMLCVVGIGAVLLIFSTRGASQRRARFIARVKWRQSPRPALHEEGRDVCAGPPPDESEWDDEGHLEYGA